MNVSFYPFYSLLLKLSNKGMGFPFPLLKLPNKEMEEYYKNFVNIASINQYQYITKSWSVAFNVATLTLSHISSHVISIFFFEFNFKIDFTNFKILTKLNLFPALSLL